MLSVARKPWLCVTLSFAVFGCKLEALPDPSTASEPDASLALDVPDPSPSVAPAMDAGADMSAPPQEPKDIDASGLADAGAADAAPARDAAVQQPPPIGQGGGAQDAGGSAPDAATVLPPPTAKPSPEPIPDCQPSPVDFTTPAPLPTGALQLDFGTWLSPVGVTARVFVTVVDDAGEVDSAYAGELRCTLPNEVEWVQASAVVAGRAEATFRFAQAGTWSVSCGLTDDPRTGTAEIVAYKTQLPVWELSVAEDALARIIANPKVREEVPANLRMGDITLPGITRLHGGSSRYLPKKSFRFKMAASSVPSGAYGKTLILRAEYADKSMLRNWLALRWLHTVTALPTPRSQFVHFRINGRYYGLMHNVERIDEAFLARWGLSTQGSLYEADPPHEFASPGGNLTPLSPELYATVYQQHAGSAAYGDLIRLIEQTLQLPQEELEAVIEDEVALRDYLSYLAFMAAIQNQDHVRKNYYLYRDPAQLRGWQIIPWDLDLTMGHLWSEAQDILDERIIVDGDVYLGVQDPAHGGYYNQLTERVLEFPAYRAEFDERLRELLSTHLTRQGADELTARVLPCIQADLIADPNKRATQEEYLSRVAEIGAFFEARRTYVESSLSP